MQRQILICIAMITLSSFVNHGNACGPEWISADEIGYGFYSQTLVSLNVGTEAIPLNLQFAPNTKTALQLFGSAWQCPLLESALTEQKNVIIVNAPDGSEQTFTPSAKSKDLYTNDNGWAGEKQGDSFMIYSSCGWRITYQAGKITELKTKDNHLLKWNYVHDQLISVTSGKTTLLQLAYNPDRQIQAIITNNEQFSFVYQKQPKLDQHLPLLASITWKNKEQERYDYLVKSANRAALKIITRSQLILGREWDTKTNALVSTEPL